MGTCALFVQIGFGLLLGGRCGGLIGKPGLNFNLTAYENFDYSKFVFNLVFCVPATISMRRYGRENQVLILSIISV